ncbi:partitioning defective 3 homolog isoform X2 [Bradysia coprophila]|uniref:partitioning defective 3 homolog isoform X2 n=1 Tax=Bradysia coprophila TaxID=38358 RepID=UPI00187DC5F4|nr:partitioning defective 3 homolog isoform X2 [Bradysia coprophila]
MFDIPPKCPALADKITGIFGWRHTYRVHHKQKGIPHTSYLHKSYSLTLPRKTALDQESWVIVHHLQTQSGILDPDDKVNDVADDREQILASFEDTGPDPGVPQGGGDGASGSSVGTGSPDIFRGPPEQKYDSENNTPHIEVTSTNTPNSGLLLQVRRSSDPSINQIGLDPRNPTLNSVKEQQDPTKRWSAAPVCRGDDDESERMLLIGNEKKGSFLSPSWESELEESQPESMTNQFSRSGRLSMQFLGDGNGYKWIDAAEKIASNYSSKSLPRESKRKEPLGQAYESMREKNGEMLLIVNEYGGPLGLTAIPDLENGGLLVQNVEPGSRAERGRLRRGDRILEINGIKLVGLSEASVQSHLRQSCSAPELRLRVIRGNMLVKQLRREMSEMIEAEEKPTTTKVATVSPTRKMPGAQNATTSLQVANTRKLGRQIEIYLTKGPHGLGFSVTTRDNPAGGHCPIYIKKILPKGAAIEDGGLKPGDRLLEVDNVPMTGKSQGEVVGILRSTMSGATVKIVVSRQQEFEEIDEREIGYSENEQDNTSPPKPPAPVFPQKSSLRKPKKIELNEQNLLEKHIIEAASDSTSSNDSAQVFPWRNREILTLHIPVHDTEKAGLGLSVKGKTGSNNSSGSSSKSTKHDGDLGIFVKSVFHGGAAHKDGRLKMNDQLLNVNGISLLGQSNAEAMETLRKALLHTGGKYPGMITLTVSRRITRPNSTIETYESNHSRSVSSTSEQSGKTVIYVSNEKLEQNGLRNNPAANTNRWSNPVLDRLTGGTGHIPPPMHQRPSPLIQSHGLRNESYYMATNETWSPSLMNGNNSVLIEEDPEPTSPTLPHPNHRIGDHQAPTSPKGDVTYDSQLSLETNPPVDAFSRDAIGRRSMSEKHHAALDAKETGTYQRNKKLREQRERDRKAQGKLGAATSMGSMESISSNANEKRDQLGELGPSLGLKKSSSLESLQTMVQEIQMSDEPRVSSLRTPRGRGREESLRAAVERPTENKPRKHWLLEDGPSDTEGGFTNRNGPFQSSLNEGKHKSRNKKPGLLKGIGHMFRFGKHRKDGVAPVDTLSDIGPQHQQQHDPNLQKLALQQAHALNDRPVGGPPTYQPPPPVPNGSAIHHNDVFNHRYSHYVNYDELQQQISPQSERLSESTIAQMRHQVMQQRVKVEEESRRNQHYHSQRSTRTLDPNGHHQRPVSSYYEYETVQNGHGSSTLGARKPSIPSPPAKWNGTISGGSARHRGPFVTQVTIREQNHLPLHPASKV